MPSEPNSRKEVDPHVENQNEPIFNWNQLATLLGVLSVILVIFLGYKLWEVADWSKIRSGLRELRGYFISEPAPPSVRAVGYGALSCAAAFDSAQGRGNPWDIISWSQGYLYGTHVEAGSSAITIPIADLGAVFRMQSFCEKHPSARFVDAVVSSLASR